MMSGLAVFIVLAVIAAIVLVPRMTRDLRATAAEQLAEQRSKLVCPHCQTRGTVTTRPVKVKRGISGGKATGAVLTGGLSLLATGLSRKERHLRAYCSNCGTDWLI